MKVFLANDTGNSSHVGCLAVSDAHRRMLRAAGAEIAAVHHVGQGEDLFCGDEEASIQRALRSRWGASLYRCDALVVNGEGTIHHGAGLHLLALLAAAQSLGKATFLVNAVQEETDAFRAVYPALTGLVVREPRSAGVARRLGGDPQVVPDSILAAEFASTHSLDFGGEVVVGDGHGDRADVLETLEAYGASRPRWPLDHDLRRADWRHAVANLATARAYVTGRHHGVYLCALAGTPFIPLPSNTHKIEALIEWSGCRIPVCGTVAEVEAGVRWAREHPDEYERFGAFLRARMPLQTLAGLERVAAGTGVHQVPLSTHVAWALGRCRREVGRLGRRLHP